MTELAPVIRLQPDETQLLGQAAELIPEPILMVEVAAGERLRVIAANPAAARLLGQPRVTGCFLDELPEGRHPETLLYHFGRCLKSGAPLTCERNLLDDRGERRLRLTLTPVRNATGRPYRIMAVGRDITDERAAEERLDLLELALDELRQAVYLLDQEGRIRYASAEAVRALGYDPVALLAMTVGDLDPELPRERWRSSWRDLATRGSIKIVGRQRRKDGTTFPVEMAASRVEFQGREYAIAVVQDITARQQVETELHARAEDFRALVENSPDIVLRYDRECRRVYANPAFLRLSGHPEPQAVLGRKPAEDAQVLSQPPAYEAKVRQALTTGEPQELLFHGQGARGSFWHRARFIPERDREGRIDSVLAIGHDVTALIQTQHALRHSNRELRALSKCSLSLIRAADEESLLREVCEIVCSDAGYRMAWVGYAEQDAQKSIRPVAWSGVESDYVVDARLSWSEHDPRGQGPAGIAIRTARSVPVQNIAADPRMVEWRGSAWRHGFGSGIALPLTDEDGKAFGVMLVYATETDAVNADEIRMLEDLALDVSFGVLALRNRLQRRQAEEALREREQTYRAIFQNSPLGLFRSTFAGRFLEVNPAFAAMFGYASPAELMAEITDIATQIYADPEARKPVVDNQLMAADATRHQLQFRRRDGAFFPVKLYLKTIHDGAGAPLFMEGIVEDMTEARRTEERLRLLDFAVNSVRDEGYLITEQGSFRFVNKRAAQALGYDQEALPGMRVEEIDPDFTAERWCRHWEELKATGSLVFEGTHRTREGRLYPVEISANYFEYEGQGYNLALARDITERRHAEEAMRRLNRALKTLSSGNEALVRADNEADLLQRMCRVAVEVGGYRFAWIGFAAADGTISPRAWAGDDAGFLAARQPFCREDPVADALRSRRTRVIHSFDEEPLSAPFRAALQQRGFAACVALPLGDEETTGVLAIYSAERDAFDADEVRLLAEMAEDLTYGIRTLRVRAEREHSVARLRASMQSTIEALSSTVELRDPCTAGHQQRVARLAVELARRMGWSEERIHSLYLAAMVHDIGKIAVPADILSKPGRLTEPEMMLVRGHADAGHEILKGVEFPWPIALIVRQHHERLDGSGYPLGLRGDEILPEARVIAVCDVMEAMTAHRPYRAGLDVEVALAEIERGRGTLFEAEVVDVCLDLFRDRGRSIGGMDKDLAAPLP